MEIVQEASGNGVGAFTLEKILNPAQCADKLGLYARVTVPPGSSVRFHEHHGDSECYFFLSGECTYNDNGVTRLIKAGDVTWTPDGEGHGLEVAADAAEPVVFMALIIKS